MGPALKIKQNKSIVAHASCIVSNLSYFLCEIETQQV